MCAWNVVLWKYWVWASHGLHVFDICKIIKDMQTTRHIQNPYKVQVRLASLSLFLL